MPTAPATCACSTSGRTPRRPRCGSTKRRRPVDPPHHQLGPHLSAHAAHQHGRCCDGLIAVHNPPVRVVPAGRRLAPGATASSRRATIRSATHGICPSCKDADARQRSTRALPRAGRCLAARGRPRRSGRLGRANAGIDEHLAFALGHAAGHLAQHGVAEDDVGGHAFGVGESVGAARAGDRTARRLGLVVRRLRRATTACATTVRGSACSAPVARTARPGQPETRVARRAARRDGLVEVADQRLMPAAGCVPAAGTGQRPGARLRPQLAVLDLVQEHVVARARRPTSRTPRSRSPGRHARRDQSPGTTPRCCAACRDG